MPLPVIAVPLDVIVPVSVLTVLVIGVSDQIEADKYLATKQRQGFGFKVGKIVAGGAR